MKHFKNLLAAMAAALVLALAVPSYGQAQKCEGPPELCQRVLELQAAIDNQKKVDADRQSKEQAEVEKAKAAAHAQDDKEKADRMAELVAAAAVLAVALRTLILSLQSWKGYFTTDKGKAWLKIVTLGVGFFAFVLTNFGFGIPWWQALVLAGGGPGAILVHELMKLAPVIKGKKTFAEAEAPDGPTAPDRDGQA